jgi:hypothetical protein
MKDHPILRIIWHSINVLILLSICLLVYAAAWEFSTRSYLRGFSDAIVPAGDDSENKVQAILAWMDHGAPRRNVQDTDSLDGRNPEDTLNYRQFLEVCGTATNAFVNLAETSGLHARRLLLLDDKRSSKHVVVEVFMDDRWAVVDPAYRKIFRLPNGEMVTRSELANPAIFRQVTQSIPDYPQSYTYERTSHIRLRRIPLLGKYLRPALNAVWPAWEEKINWTLLVERDSFAMLVVSGFFLCIGLASRVFLGFYCFHRFGIVRLRLRDQVVRVGQVLAGSIHH